jgi:hypothetical protein
MTHAPTNLELLVGRAGCEPVLRMLGEHASEFLRRSTLPPDVNLKILSAHALLTLAAVLRAEPDLVGRMIAFMVDDEQLPEWLGKAALEDALERHDVPAGELASFLAELHREREA